MSLLGLHCSGLIQLVSSLGTLLFKPDPASLAPGTLLFKLDPVCVTPGTSLFKPDPVCVIRGTVVQAGSIYLILETSLYQPDPSWACHIAQDFCFTCPVHLV